MPGRQVKLTLAAAGCAGLLLGVLAPAVGARPKTGDLRQRAAALARQVQVLTAREEAATQAYDLAQGRLGQAVTAELLTRRALAADQEALARSQAGELAGVRALYESGGPLGLYSALLGSASLSALSDAAVTVGNLESGEALSTSGAARLTGTTSRAAARLARLAAAATAAARAAAVAAATVRAEVAAEQQLLASANGAVAAAAAADAAAAAAAGERSFLAALQAARGGAVGPDAPPDALAAAAIAAIRTKLGTPYQWGGTGPEAFDCSGLTGYAFAAAGVQMPRTAAQQYLAGTHPTLADLRPGDLLFWASDPAEVATIDHVGLYAGGGMMYSDDHTGDTARLQPVWWDGFAGITRVVPAIAAAVPGPRWTPGG